MQDHEILLNVWVEHFQKLAKSKLGDTPEMLSWKDRMRLLEVQSQKNEDLGCSLYCRRGVGGCKHT